MKLLLITTSSLFVTRSSDAFSPASPIVPSSSATTSSRPFKLFESTSQTEQTTASNTAAAKSSTASSKSSTTTTTTRTKENQPWILNPKYRDDYSQDRDWGFVYSAVPPEAEASYEVLDIEGTIPDDLQGTYYKVGGAKFERGGQRYEHVLDGDGFVVAIRIQQDGRVQYTGRFVETEYFLEEQAADAVRYRNVFGTQPPGGFWTNAFDLTLKNVANTNVLKWGKRLFALWEAGRPYELDPVTLETLPPTSDGPFADLGAMDCNLRGVTIDEGGPIDQIVRVGKFFTAHPHIIDNDTLVAFTASQNAQKKSMEMVFLEYDQQWNVKHRKPYKFMDGVSAPHDFSVGDNYYGFVQNKIEVDTFAYVLGLKSPTQMMQLQLKQPAVLHLVPRKDSDNVAAMQVEVPPYFCLHNLARLEEDGDLITMYSNGWDLQDENFFPHDKESVPFLGSWSGQYPDFAVVPPAKYFKTTINRRTKSLVSHEQVVSGLVMEFETQDERQPEICYLSASTLGGESVPGVGLAKINLQSVETEFWWAQPKIFTGEVAPVPKQNGDKGSWLLTLLYDATNRRTSLAILDSERFSAGPVARIHLEHHISYGLHGMFAREDKDVVV